MATIGAVEGLAARLLLRPGAEDEGRIIGIKINGSEGKYLLAKCGIKWQNI